MDPCTFDIDLVWDWVGDRLDVERAAEVEDHVRSCAACRDEASDARAVRGRLVPDPATPLPAAPDVSEGSIGERGLRDAPDAPLPDVMTLEEVARYLRVDVEAILAQIDDLPAFEFAGRLRFRKESLERWMEERERLRRDEILARTFRRRA